MPWIFEYGDDALYALLLALVGVVAAWCGLSRRHWSWRFAVVVAIAWALLPTQAYEPIIYFLLVAIQVTVVLVVVRVVRDRRSGPLSEGPASQLHFSLKELLLATSLAGAGTGILALLAMEDLQGVHLVVRSSVASTILILAACFIVTASSRVFVKAIVAVSAVAITTMIWHRSSWVELLVPWVIMGMLVPEDLLAKNFVAAVAVLVIVTVGIVAMLPRQAGISRRWLLWTARCAILLTVLIVLPFGAYLYFRLSVYETPPDVELPNPNGYDVLVRAGNVLLNVNVPDPETDPPDAFAKFAKKHAKALELAREGLALPCRNPLSFTADDMTTLGNRSMSVRRLVRGLRAEAMARAFAGDYPAAAGSGVDAVRLSADCARGGIFVDMLVGVALQANGMDALKRIRPRLDAATCRVTATQLAEIDRNREAFDEFVHTDRIWSQCAEGWRGRLDLARDDLLYGEYQNVEMMRVIEARHVALLRLMIAQLSVQAYHLDHGNPPRSLDDVVPDYLSAVPFDPFSGTLLRYRADRPQPLVYSVGPDGDDDGGKALSWSDLAANADGDMVLDYPEEDWDSGPPSEDASDE